MFLGTPPPSVIIHLFFPELLPCTWATFTSGMTFVFAGGSATSPAHLDSLVRFRSVFHYLTRRYKKDLQPRLLQILVSSLKMSLHLTSKTVSVIYWHDVQMFS